MVQATTPSGVVVVVLPRECAIAATPNHGTHYTAHVSPLAFVFSVNAKNPAAVSPAGCITRFLAPMAERRTGGVATVAALVGKKKPPVRRHLLATRSVGAAGNG